MIIIHEPYQNLDEVWISLNRMFLLDPYNSVKCIRGAQGMQEDVLLKAKTTDFSIDLGKLGYGFAKWPHLVKSYVNLEKMDTFWNKIPSLRGLSWSFRFNEREGRNGPCLIAIVLTRDDSKVPFERAKVIWRTAEVQRRWAADLALIHVFFRDMPEECRKYVKLEEISLYLSHCYQSWLHVGPLMHLFGITPDMLDRSHEFCRRVYDSFYRVYASDRQYEYKYSPTRRMVTYYKNLLEGKLPKIPVESLSIRSVFMK